MEPRVGIVTGGAHEQDALSAEIRALRAMGIAAETAVGDARFAAGQFRAAVADLVSRGAQVLLVTPGAGAVEQAESEVPLPVVPVDPLRPELAAWRAARILAVAHPELAPRFSEYGAMRERRTAFERVRLPDAGGDAPPPAQEQGFRPHPKDAEDLARLEREFAESSARTRPRQPVPAPPKPLSYTPALQEVFSAARGIARAAQNDEVATEHFLAAILDTPDCAAHAALVSAGTDLETLAGIVATQLPAPAAGPAGVFALGEEAQEMLDVAKQAARDHQREWLTTADLLESLAILTDSSASDALWSGGLTATAIADALRVAPVAREIADGEARRAPQPKPEPVATLDPDEVEKIRRKVLRPAPPRLQAGDAVAQAEPRAPEETGTSEAELPSGPSRISVCDPDNPGIEVVEEAADRILEGGVVALPSESGYMLACDATNPAAVRALRAMRGLADDRPVGVFVHSTATLKHIASTVPAAAETLAEEFWPGLLTVVLARHPLSFRAVSGDATIGVRIPRNYVALSVLSMVGRPVAAVRAVTGSGASARTASEVKAQYPHGVAPIVDGGTAGEDGRSTVISLAGGSAALLREGAVARAEMERRAGVKITG